jgi:hypothetical protein
MLGAGFGFVHGGALQLFAESLMQQRFFQFVKRCKLALGVCFGKGDAVERIVKKSGDPPLFTERRYTHKFIMNEISVKGRNACTGGESQKIKLS